MENFRSASSVEHKAQFTIYFDKRIQTRTAVVNTQPTVSFCKALPAVFCINPLSFF
jgi:hypothetical protein